MESNIFNTTVRHIEGRSLSSRIAKDANRSTGLWSFGSIVAVLSFPRDHVRSKVFRMSRPNSLDSHWYSVCVI